MPLYPLASLPGVGATPDARVEMERETFVETVVAAWLLAFLKRGWRERRAMLDRIAEEIRVTWRGADSADALAESVTARLIDRLHTAAVTCPEQAHVYLRSGDEGHRNAGTVWLVLNDPASAMFLDTPIAHSLIGGNKRAAIRHELNIAGALAANDHLSDARLVDVSQGGAKVMIDNPPPMGTRVYLDIPFLGRVIARVVWVVASFIGLSFVQSPQQQVAGAA